jgi:hypothetical protein
VRGDKVLCYLYVPQNKQQSFLWKPPSIARTTKFWQDHSNGKRRCRSACSYMAILQYSCAQSSFQTVLCRFHPLQFPVLHWVIFTSLHGWRAGSAVKVKVAWKMQCSKLHMVASTNVFNDCTNVNRSESPLKNSILKATEFKIWHLSQNF